MKRFFFFIILLLGLASGCKRPLVTTETNVTDSTTVQIKERKVDVIVPGKTLTVYKVVEAPCPNMEESVTKGNGVTIKTSIKDGKLKTECTCDEYKAQITAKDSLINRLRKEKTTNTVVVTEYVVHWYDYACRAIVAVLLLLLIIFILIKAFK